jgi:uncharacterized repeat protein (TIGR02543 family)
MPKPPSIATQPKNQSITVGQSATFSALVVTATGSGTVTFKWETYRAGSWLYANGAGCTGMDTATLTVATTDTSLNGRRYRCVVSNAGGSVTSNEVTLTVTAASPPSITTHPQNKSITEGQSAEFKVVASGSGTLTYQWQLYIGASGKPWGDMKDNSTVSGSKTSTLTLNNTDVSNNNARYRCMVKNEGGTVYSNEGVLTVTAPPAAPTTYTVKFNTGGGSAVANQTVNSGAKATKPADPAKEDNTFAGWYKNEGLTTAYSFNDPVTANITLYAKWTDSPPQSSTSSGAASSESTTTTPDIDDMAGPDGYTTEPNSGTAELDDSATPLESGEPGPISGKNGSSNWMLILLIALVAAAAAGVVAFIIVRKKENAKSVNTTKEFCGKPIDEPYIQQPHGNEEE